MLLLGVYALVGFVEGLDGLLQDGLHPGTPLLPQAPRHAHHRVCGAVAVGEHPRVEEVDAGSSPLVGQVYEPHPVGEGLGDVLKQAVHQVGVGVHHHDGVSVPALGLLPHLVDDYVVHEGGLAHAGAGHVEVVTPEQVVGEVDVPAFPGGGLPHVRSAPDSPRRGE